MKTLREEIAELIQPVWNNPEKKAQIKKLIGKYWEPADIYTFNFCYRDDLCEGVDKEQFESFIDELKKIVE